MTRDPLDDVLDRSAPELEPFRRQDLDAMIVDARSETRASRHPRVLIAGAAAAALLITGVGTAAATDGFSWAPWALDPLGAIPFTMANGFDCELRFSDYTGGADPGFVGEVNGVLRDWYGTADVLGAVETFVPAARANPDLDALGLQPGETVESLPPGEAEHREWVREWMAWDWAVSEAEWQELARHGIQPGDPRMEGSERSGQIQCFDENHELYTPGGAS
ncbi:hypothetical protein [Pseudolysinimonas sp.]|uniref:hypothetical protein n=1 Tax=Pseudolysinimonas sp. TaxID=2680009 RepID=UPI00286C31C9|nr:hypothetical protein [Pseudolysinimonas sp.]